MHRDQTGLSSTTRDIEDGLGRGEGTAEDAEVQRNEQKAAASLAHLMTIFNPVH